MSAQLAVFFILAAMAVAGAVSLILQRHPIHSALSLIVVMVALAGLYLLLEAEFVAMTQIIVYAGAIMVLFVFVIMLLNAGAEATRGRSWTAQVLGVPLMIVLLGALCYFSLQWFPDAGFVKFGDFPGGGTQQVGYALFTGYLLP